MLHGSIGSPALFAAFIGFVLVMLALDLGVFHRKAHAVGLREAAIWSGVWVGLAALFAAILWIFSSDETALAFTAGYVIEKALAVDNIFVFVVLFAVDSIPAVFAVTRDPFIVFTSNIFAILGLRSMYFLLANVVTKFRYLKIGLSAILVFVGAKMLLAGVVEVHVVVSLAII